MAAFQELIDQHLGNFAELSNKIGGDVAALAPLLLNCVAQSKALIAEASRAKKPADIQPVIKPLSEAIAAVSTFQSKSRDIKQKNNVYGVGEGIGIFSWVVVEPAPAPFAAEMVGSAKFYTNKILQEFKVRSLLKMAVVDCAELELRESGKGRDASCVDARVGGLCRVARALYQEVSHNWLDLEPSR